MSAQKDRPVTAAQRQARRQNGQKSTGPRTSMGKKLVSLNAVKHGMYSCPSIQTMAVLHENPLDYINLLTGLIDSFHPRNPAEVILLEDIAQLHWQRRRNQIARGARISLAIERLELERAELERKAEKWISLDASEEEVKRKGLRSIADSPAKFQELRSNLYNLIDLVKRQQFGKATGYLNRLYGEAAEEATTRGQTIRDFFKVLDLETPAAGSGRAPAQPGAGEPTSASELRDWRRMLVGMLNEEIEEVGQEWHLYARQHVEITPALRGSLYAPGPEDRPLLREQALVDGLLVRKYKVLLELQRERRRAEAEEGELDWDITTSGLIPPPPQEGAGAAPAASPQEGGPASSGEGAVKASAAGRETKVRSFQLCRSRKRVARASRPLCRRRLAAAASPSLPLEGKGRWRRQATVGGAGLRPHPSLLPSPLWGRGTGGEGVTEARNPVDDPPPSLGPPGRRAIFAPPQGACPGSALNRNRSGACLRVQVPAQKKLRNKATDLVQNKQPAWTNSRNKATVCTRQPAADTPYPRPGAKDSAGLAEKQGQPLTCPKVIGVTVNGTTPPEKSGIPAWRPPPSRGTTALGSSGGRYPLTTGLTMGSTLLGR